MEILGSKYKNILNLGEVPYLFIIRQNIIKKSLEYLYEKVIFESQSRQGAQNCKIVDFPAHCSNLVPNVKFRQQLFCYKNVIANKTGWFGEKEHILPVAYYNICC